MVAVVVAFSATNFIQSVAAQAQTQTALIAAGGAGTNGNTLNSAVATTGPAKPAPAPQTGGQRQNSGGERGGSSRAQINWQLVADTLGISFDQLNSKLSNGETLSQIASTQNVDIQKVKDAILANYKDLLTQAVKEGNLTQPQSDSLYQRSLSQLDSLVNLPLVGN